MRTLLLAAISFAVLVTECGAVDLTITNRSFESPVLAEGSFPQGVPAGWSGVGTIGIMNPADDFFTGASDSGSGPSPLDGRNAVAINFGGQITYQDPAWIAQSSFVYKLTVLAGQRNGVPFGSGTISLWAGTNLLMQGVPNPPNGTFIAFSLSYTSPPAGPMLGRALRIELTAPSPTSQVWFDNVHLFAEPFVCSPHKARAEAQLFNGIFVGATIIDTGCGYTNPPAVTIQGGGGFGATATAQIIDGRVSEIRVTNGGCCYTNPPTILIDSPPHVPILGIKVSKVLVTMNLNQGQRYVVESSFDMTTWAPTGPAFTAPSDIVESEFDVNVTGRFFRVLQLP